MYFISKYFLCYHFTSAPVGTADRTLGNLYMESSLVNSFCSKLLKRKPNRLLPPRTNLICNNTLISIRVLASVTRLLFYYLLPCRVNPQYPKDTPAHSWHQLVGQLAHCVVAGNATWAIDWPTGTDICQILCYGFMGANIMADKLFFRDVCLLNNLLIKDPLINFWCTKNTVKKHFA